MARGTDVYPTGAQTVAVHSYRECEPGEARAATRRSMGPRARTPPDPPGQAMEPPSTATVTPVM